MGTRIFGGRWGRSPRARLASARAGPARGDRNWSRSRGNGSSGCRYRSLRRPLRRPRRGPRCRPWCRPCCRPWCRPCSAACVYDLCSGDCSGLQAGRQPPRQHRQHLLRSAVRRCGIPKAGNSHAAGQESGVTARPRHGFNRAVVRCCSHETLASLWAEPSVPALFNDSKGWNPVRILARPGATC